MSRTKNKQTSHTKSALHGSLTLCHALQVHNPKATQQELESRVLRPQSLRLQQTLKRHKSASSLELGTTLRHPDHEAGSIIHPPSKAVSSKRVEGQSLSLRKARQGWLLSQAQKFATAAKDQQALVT